MNEDMKEVERYRFSLFNNTINYQIILLIGIVLGACNYSNEHTGLSSNPQKEALRDTKKDPSVLAPATQSYRLWHTVDQFDLKSFNYYGGFFENRLKFFYRSDPGLRIADTDVNLLMLYFLDERLVKIRYHLNKDITSTILDSLGLGILKTRYNRRKKIYATDRTIQRLKNFNRNNGNPDKYDIIWDRKIIESSYHVDPNPSSLYNFDTIRAHFVFVDQLKSYRKNLIVLENELRNKMMSSIEN
jgi:hypothetical protein